MVIRPKVAPDIFIKLFGTADTERHDESVILLQWKRVEAWDAAIQHVLLHKDLQQSVLTHPQPQPKGD